jgi:CRP-like cAMP-binding protein
LPNALIRKLRSYRDIPAAEVRQIEAMCRRVRIVPRRKELRRAGEETSTVQVVVDGWAARYRLVRDGGRVILGYLLPGDVCEPHARHVGAIDHGILTLTTVAVAEMAADQFAAVLDGNPALAAAHGQALATDEAVLREWLVNVGARSAYQRVAHLLCELEARLAKIGCVEASGFDMPLTQEFIGNTLGLTTIHTNRVIQQLRADGLIVFGRRRLMILDLDRLRSAADFHPAYLDRTRPACDRSRYREPQLVD